MAVETAALDELGKLARRTLVIGGAAGAVWAPPRSSSCCPRGPGDRHRQRRQRGRFTMPVARVFPAADLAQAHRVSEVGHVRGKLVVSVA